MHKAQITDEQTKHQSEFGQNIEVHLKILFSFSENAMQY